jgi:hypothetical protein
LQNIRSGQTRKRNLARQAGHDVCSGLTVPRHGLENLCIIQASQLALSLVVATRETPYDHGVPEERYRVTYPLLVLFKDATRDLIRPDTLITLDGLPFDEGERVNVKWAGKRGSIFVQDLRFRATRELES